MKIANKNKIFVIEDNAHGYGAEFKEKKLGSIGHLGTLSFHATKNFTCGEGGALLINDSSLIKRAKIIIEKGTNRLAFLNNEIKKYEWVDKGSSYIISDILASILYSQLLNSKKILQKRKKFGIFILEIYQTYIKPKLYLKIVIKVITFFVFYLKISVLHKILLNI